RDMGAPHAAELPYVFGEFNSPKMAWGPVDHKISDQVIGYWTNFAKTGDPNGPGLPRWEAMTDAGNQTVRFSATSAEPATVDHLDKLKVIDGVFKARREAAAAAP
ncbi:MAG: carboxylesterase family protein, partial [Caulobacteraceae bacterium]|nr:carboxylesterase family protein [Caulobacter sp.]